MQAIVFEGEQFLVPPYLLASTTVHGPELPSETRTVETEAPHQIHQVHPTPPHHHNHQHQHARARTHTHTLTQTHRKTKPPQHRETQRQTQANKHTSKHRIMSVKIREYPDFCFRLQVFNSEWRTVPLFCGQKVTDYWAFALLCIVAFTSIISDHHMPVMQQTSTSRRWLVDFPSLPSTRSKYLLLLPFYQWLHGLVSFSLLCFCHFTQLHPQLYLTANKVELNVLHKRLPKLSSATWTSYGV